MKFMVGLLVVGVLDLTIPTGVSRLLVGNQVFFYICLFLLITAYLFCQKVGERRWAIHCEQRMVVGMLVKPPGRAGQTWAAGREIVVSKFLDSDSDDSNVEIRASDYDKTSHPQNFHNFAQLTAKDVIAWTPANTDLTQLVGFVTNARQPAFLGRCLMLVDSFSNDRATYTEEEYDAMDIEEPRRVKPVRYGSTRFKHIKDSRETSFNPNRWWVVIHPANCFHWTDTVHVPLSSVAWIHPHYSFVHLSREALRPLMFLCKLCEKGSHKSGYVTFPSRFEAMDQVLLGGNSLAIYIGTYLFNSKSVRN